MYRVGGKNKPTATLAAAGELGSKQISILLLVQRLLARLITVYSRALLPWPRWIEQKQAPRVIIIRTRASIMSVVIKTIYVFCDDTILACWDDQHPVIVWKALVDVGERIMSA